MAKQDTTVIFAGGDAPDPAVVRALPADAYVIAADSGLEHAHAAGRAVDLVVGDFDSVDPVTLARAEAAGIPIETHPVDKDYTDLELALVAALRVGRPNLILVGIGGGRIDHYLANLLLLGHEQFAAVTIVAFAERTRISVVRDRIELQGAVGDLVSLLPIGGPAHGVTTTRLHWPLRGETLVPGEPRGLSNTFSSPTAEVSLTAGVLVIIQPEGMQ
jgi:thiamine pyrophosphokinase